MKKAALIFLGLVLLAAVPLAFTPQASGAPLGVNAYNYEQEVAQSDVPVLVQFTADWCPYCRKMQPLVNKLQEMGAYGMKVVDIDMDEEPELAAQFTVQMLPTQFILHKGRIVARHDGAMKEAALFGWVRDVSAQLAAR